MHYFFQKQFVFFFLLVFLFVGVPLFAAQAQSSAENFFVENTYDLFGRKEIDTTLIRESKQLYFYGETNWWNTLSAAEHNNIQLALFDLAGEFENIIHPTLTSTFGIEPHLGVDGDSKITIVIHEMAQEAGGYFNSGDVYSKLQNPRSNEREMLYLNSQFIGEPQAKSFLAHEFLHIITANQKDLLRGVTEETWLNEARAEYGPTLLGYDDVYEHSNLQRRVRDFLKNPSDPLAGWLNKPEDYGAVSMFIQYVVDHYGVEILVDSLQSSQVGIESLNTALQKNGFKQTFSDIFQDWAIALLVNDCSLGEYYCYKNTHLQELRITPGFYYLPGGESVFATHHTISSWSSNWHRLVGGGQDLTLTFDGADTADFQVPYVLCDKNNSCSVQFFSLDTEQQGKITFSDFNSTYSSVTIVPFLQNGADERNGGSAAFSWEVTGQKSIEGQENATLISQLLARITDLQEQVRQLQAQLAARGGVSQAATQQNRTFVSCSGVATNLSFGMRNSAQVRCLQEFLRSQGPEIYPEGLVTGNFLGLTEQAVIRFQEKYALEILAPVGESRGTGYVGQKTRDKISQLIGSS